MKIAVFCSANKNIDPDFFTLTEEMGKWMAENGRDLVFGGCNSGLMDCIGKAVKAEWRQNHRCGSYACRARRQNLPRPRHRDSV